MAFEGLHPFHRDDTRKRAQLFQRRSLRCHQQAVEKGVGAAQDHGPGTRQALLQQRMLTARVRAIGPNAPRNTRPMILGRRNIAGSLVGGIQETQEMLHFCAAHGIVSDIELIKATDINLAYERMQKNDVKYRFVIDMASLV